MSISPALIAEVERRYGVAVAAAESLGGGYECDVVRLTTADGARLVLRVSPRGRSVEELAWAFDLAAFAATRIPETVAPLAARDGSLLFLHEGRPVSVFPFAAGRMLDGESSAERDAAARLLGRLHSELPAWPRTRPRPESPDPVLTTPDLASPEELAAQSAALPDAELDEFFTWWRAHPRLPAVPLHADFYHANLLCEDGRVTALLDWDDARVSSREYELAWSIWVFAQTQAPEVRLDAGRALQFLGTYAETGPVDVSDRGFVVPLIRAQLRYGILHAAEYRRRGRPVDENGLARRKAAFEALHTVTL